MFSLRAGLRTAGLTRARAAPAKAVKRSVGGGGHAPPPEGGLEGYVRGIFPHNYQMALAVMGLYAGLYVVAKLVGAVTGGGKKKAVADAAHGHAAPVAASGDAIPSPDSAEFGDWLAQPGSIEKLLNSA